MAAQLIPGQNAVLTQRVLRFGATGDVALDLSVLVVGDNRIARSSDDFVFYNQPQAAGVRLSGDGVDISLDEVDSAARGLLCIASADPPTTPVPRLSATLTDPTGAVADFAIPLVGLETAVICFELYRRGTDWKVRALGQGYSGGLAQLLDVHGVEVDDAPEPAPVATPPAQADPAIEIEPLDTRRALERMWMIFEDAARSTASVTSSRSYALDRLDNELSMAVADPAMRQIGRAHV